MKIHLTNVIKLIVLVKVNGIIREGIRRNVSSYFIPCEYSVAFFLLKKPPYRYFLEREREVCHARWALILLKEVKLGLPLKVLLNWN